MLMDLRSLIVWVWGMRVVMLMYKYPTPVWRSAGIEHEELVDTVSSSFALESGTQEKTAARSLFVTMRCRTVCSEEKFCTKNTHMHSYFIFHFLFGSNSATSVARPGCKALVRPTSLSPSRLQQVIIWLRKLPPRFLAQAP